MNRKYLVELLFLRMHPDFVIFYSVDVHHQKVPSATERNVNCMKSDSYNCCLALVQQTFCHNADACNIKHLRMCLDISTVYK